MPLSNGSRQKGRGFSSRRPEKAKQRRGAWPKHSVSLSLPNYTTDCPAAWHQSCCKGFWLFGGVPAGICCQALSEIFATVASTEHSEGCFEGTSRCKHPAMLPTSAVVMHMLSLSTESALSNGPRQKRRGSSSRRHEKAKQRRGAWPKNIMCPCPCPIAKRTARLPGTKAVAKAFGFFGGVPAGICC